MSELLYIIFVSVLVVLLLMLWPIGVPLLLIYGLLIFIGPKKREEKAKQKLQSTLMEHEKVIEAGIQKRWLSLLKRRTLLAITNSRIVIIDRGLLGGFQMKDIQWKDLEDAQIVENTFPSISGADLSFSYRLHKREKRKITSKKEADPSMDVFKELSVKGIPANIASKIYSRAQAAEQEWEEKRRVRGMEEARAASGGFYIGNPQSFSTAPSVPEDGQNKNSDNPLFEEIEKAKKLLDENVISDAEFQELKSKILSRSY